MIEKVFIVDEDVKVRDFLYELFSEVGFGVLTLPAGQPVLELLKNDRPALIIISDTVGEDKGFSLAEKIRRFAKDIKIIMMAGDPKADLEDPRVRAIGIAAYIRKEFENPEVIKSILSILKQSSPAKAVEVPQKWGRVLVVDDQFDLRETLGAFLRCHGFGVETAVSGEECLQKLKEKSFDVVLLDIALEGMDGLLTLRHIKETNKSIKVVMVTGFDSSDVLAQAKAMGADDYLVKPFNFETLEATLLSLLITDKNRKKADC